MIGMLVASHHVWGHVYGHDKAKVGMKANLQNTMLGSHILLEHRPSIGNEFACIVFLNIKSWVKDEMNEEDPMGMPKTLIFLERILNENGVF